MGDAEKPRPRPLEYARPQPPRTVEELLTDYVRQDLESGRWAPRKPQLVLLLWIILVVLAWGAIWVLWSRSIPVRVPI